MHTTRALAVTGIVRVNKELIIMINTKQRTTNMTISMRTQISETSLPKKETKSSNKRRVAKRLARARTRTTISKKLINQPHHNKINKKLFKIKRSKSTRLRSLRSTRVVSLVRLCSSATLTRASPQLAVKSCFKWT